MKKSQLLIALAVVLLLVGFGGIYYRSWSAQQMAQSYLQLTGLNTLGNRPAPGFQLVDQQGRSVSLKQFRGHVVVLEFMDPRCKDICPIISQEFIQADHLLGAQQSNIDFVAINVNQYHNKVADVFAFSHEQGLTHLPNWYFATGSTAALQAAWRNYSVYVQPNKTGDVVHSSYMYFINPLGQEVYLANPDNKVSTIAGWGHAIAYYAQQLA